MRAVTSLLAVCTFVQAGELTGRVLGEGGSPLRSVVVTAFSLDQEPRVVRSAATDDSGRYRFGNLGTGQYSLVVSSTSGAAFFLAPEDWDYDRARVEETGKLVKDIWLRKITTLSGSLLHRDRPVAGAQVELLRFNRDGRPHKSWPLRRSRTGDDGSFQLTAHYPGKFKVVCSVGEYRIGLNTIRLEGGQAHLQLGLGTSELTLSVVDSSGRPVGAAQISCAGENGSWRVDYRPRKAPRRGSYRIPYLSTGNVSVLVVGDKGASAHCRTKLLPGPGNAVELTLGAIRVTVEVRDRKGTPKPGVNVQVEPERGGPPVFGAPTDKSGAAHFDLRPGRWRLGVVGLHDFAWIGKPRIVRVGNDPVIVKLLHDSR